MNEKRAIWSPPQTGRTLKSSGCPLCSINVCRVLGFLGLFFFSSCGKTTGSITRGCVLKLLLQKIFLYKGLCFGAHHASCTAGLYEVIDSSIAWLLHYCFLEETDCVHQLNPQTCGLYSNMKWGVTVNKLYVWLDLFWYMPNICSMQVHPLGSLRKLLLRLFLSDQYLNSSY